MVAVNEAGQSEPSEVSDYMIAATVPDMPTNLIRVSADREQITIGWQAPAYNGGTPISGYKVYWDAGGHTLLFELAAEGTFDAL